MHYLFIKRGNGVPRCGRIIMCGTYSNNLAACCYGNAIPDEKRAREGKWGRVRVLISLRYIQQNSFILVSEIIKVRGPI